MRLPFLKQDRPIPVRLHVDLGFDSGRLADLIQLLARQDAIIRDLTTDRDLENALFPFGMPERFAEVLFLVANAAHQERILKQLAESGFPARILPNG
jgi:hypothetical protein